MIGGTRECAWLCERELISVFAAYRKGRGRGDLMMLHKYLLREESVGTQEALLPRRGRQNGNQGWHVTVAFQHISMSQEELGMIHCLHSFPNLEMGWPLFHPTSLSNQMASLVNGTKAVLRDRRSTRVECCSPQTVNGSSAGSHRN